ncbi:MAG TPA: NADH-quinone oxidoreductase subunit J [Cyclobacteriaceae bacterium]|mgnify:CR=1 FL=1|nr:NADH-quinone oxidoreductase subunit J [Cyclobacteriaceae bacterium]
MAIIFYMASAIAVIATVMVITRHNLVHALLYLVVSFLAVAIVFYVLGAPFIAVLEIIIYAGAIVVLLIFVIMMLNLRQESVAQEKQWFSGKIIIGPLILASILLVEMLYILTSGEPAGLSENMIEAKAVGMSLYGPYVLGVELSGILLMSGIVGAYHLGRQKKKVTHRFLEKKEE